MKKVFILGFQPYNEALYPHTFDFLQSLEKSFCVKYVGIDDRGYGAYCLGIGIKQVNSFKSVYRFGLLWWNLRKQQRKIRSELRELLKAEPYDIVIAIDHTAYNLVCDYAAHDSLIVYWSQDLITPDHNWRDSWYIRQLLKENCVKINKCGLIIIQDLNRAAVMDSIVNSHDIPKVLLPVSLKHETNPLLQKTSRNDTNFSSRVLLMQMGTIHPVRASEQILMAFQQISDKYQLAFQGYVSAEIATAIDKAERKPIVFPGAETYYEMRQNVSQADIGIVAVAEKNLNNYFMSMACGQLVEFFRLGIPVIVIFSEEMGQFVVQNQCGLFLKCVDGIPAAADEICRKYEMYSLNSHDTYQKFFNIEKHMNEVKSAMMSRLANIDA